MTKSKEMITVVVWASTGYVGSQDEEEVQVLKSDYEKAEDKEAFLKAIYDDYISNVMESGYYIKEGEEN